MSDYIEREAAKSKYCETCNWYGTDLCNGCETPMSRIPTADVAPVRRAHYIGEYDGYADGNPVYDMWYCSECGCYFEDWDEKPTYNYCPNCGAKMEETE